MTNERELQIDERHPRIVKFIPLDTSINQSLRLDSLSNVWKLYIGEDKIRVLDRFENLFINSAIKETSRMKT